MTDEMLKALGEKDGYVGINFYPYFLSDAYDEAKPWRPGVKEIADHMITTVPGSSEYFLGLGYMETCLEII